MQNSLFVPGYAIDNQYWPVYDEFMDLNGFAPFYQPVTLYPPVYHQPQDFIPSTPQADYNGWKAPDHTCKIEEKRSYPDKWENPDYRLEGRSIDLAQSKEKASECSPNVPERKMWEAPRCTPSTAAASNCHKPDSEKKQNKKKADPMLIQLAYAWHVLRGHINYHRLKLRQEGTPSVWVEDLEELDALDMPRCETCARGNVNPFDPDSRWVMDIENGGNWMVLD